MMINLPLKNAIHLSEASVPTTGAFVRYRKLEFFFQNITAKSAYNSLRRGEHTNDISYFHRRLPASLWCQHCIGGERKIGVSNIRHTVSG